MLTEFVVRDFKSFREGRLRLSPITVLVGANASGKSNVLEALQLLSWLARGKRLTDLLLAIREGELTLRGPPKSLVRAGARPIVGFSVTTNVPSEHEASYDAADLKLEVRIRIDERGLSVTFEELRELASILRPNGRKQRAGPVYSAVSRGRRGDLKGTILGSESRRAQATWSADQLILAQQWRLRNPEKIAIADVDTATAEMNNELKRIYFSDSVPRLMRGYADKIEGELAADGANVSAVLFRLCTKEKLKDLILEFVRALPEENVLDLAFLEGPRGEVMLKLMEAFGGKERWTEAALLSDGTLRVLAIAAAMFSIPEGSTLVIEEIDNGVHPARARTLMENIERAASKRSLQVVLTTHSPALLDALSDRALMGVQVFYREHQTGDSRIIRLPELPRYPELVAEGSLGRVISRGALDRFLGMSGAEDADRRATGEKWLESLRDGL